MTTTNDFAAYYRTLSNAELLNIINHPHNYQPLAVETAQAELNSRQLSGEEENEAWHTLTVQNIQQMERYEQSKAMERKIRSATNNFFNAFNPAKAGLYITERYIRVIMIAFTGYFLFQVVLNLSQIANAIVGLYSIPFFACLMLIPLVLLLAGLITFWRRQTLGWVLLTLFITFAGVVELMVSYQIVSLQLAYSSDTVAGLPLYILLTYLVHLAFIGGALYALCRKDVRQAFKIDTQKLVATLLLTTLATIALLQAAKH